MAERISQPRASGATLGVGHGRLLEELGRELSGTLTAEGVAKATIEVCRPALDARGAAVYQMEGGALELLLAAGELGGADDRRDDGATTTAGSLAEAVTARRPIYRPDGDDGRRPASAGGGPRRAGATACLPLVVELEVVGALVFGFEREGGFSADERRLLEALADHVAPALARAARCRDSEEARRRAEGDRAELAILYRLLDAVTRAASPTEAAEAALDAMGDALRVERAAILLDDAEGAMRFIAWRGLSDGYRRALEGPAPLPPELARQTTFIEDCEATPELASHWALFREERIRAIGSVPLVHGDELLGRFMVYDAAPRGFDERERRLARAVAGHVAGAVGRLRADERERASAEALTRAVHFSDLFIGMVGHDLRNPLSAIANSAELLRMAGGAGEPARVGERILRSTGRMSRMIDQLLDVTRIRLGHGLPLSRVIADLGAMLPLLIEEVRAGHPDAPIEHAVHGDTAGVWDPDRLGQLVSNLLGNAIQHGTPGQPIAVIVDGTRPDVVSLAVANGGAIPPELLPHLFEPFRQGRRKGAKASGLGLGLYIGKAVAMGHGGRLDVASDEALGTRMTVVLPRGR